MCTLSVITHENGYLLGMNRDERLDRAPAGPPEVYRAATVAVLYPRDAAGGTWIAANERGVALALLNKNRDSDNISSSPTIANCSRGVVVATLIRSALLHDVEKDLRGMSLAGMKPFRLVAVFPAERQIHEWSWNAAQITAKDYPWQPRHFFSSGLSDDQAAESRSDVCCKAWEEIDAGSAAWLRRLHAIHLPGPDGRPGPFGLCVHRREVETLSYTEVEIAAGAVQMSYSAGSPCRGAAFISRSLPTTDQIA